ncbi:pickpocket protein 28-like [Daktulosphaira vitifoliae]|uniref:pickpocket protein 28-like n=1 Tax=Daktulosphaira vitifoliae TaxID=58002 RepID=UPI0021A9BE23|nr:pickpocket protein 28-like [Daktulosphaira vitifoliae]
MLTKLHLQDYSEKISIHGLRYVLKKGAKQWEKILWMTILTVAGICILNKFYQSWQLYNHSLIQIIIEDPLFPLKEIDFPAITVCMNSNAMYSKVKTLTEIYSNESNSKKYFENSIKAISIMRFPHFNALAPLVRSLKMEKIPPEEIRDIMLYLGPTIDDMLVKCFWRGIKYNCSDLFRRQRSEIGFCYSFNSKTADRNSNYSDRNPPLTGEDDQLIPLRTNSAGRMSGLELILRNMEYENFPGKDAMTGYNVMVHNPGEFPDETMSYKAHLDINRVSQISVSVAKVSADQSLYWINQKDRKCTMKKSSSYLISDDLSREGNPESFCLKKCRLDVIYKFCKCIPYYSITYEDLSETCGVEHLNCLNLINVRLRNFPPPIEESGFPDWSLPEYMNCSCPTPCSFISYTSENRKITTFNEFNIRNFSLESNHIYLDIHYKKPYVISFRRSLKYSAEELIVAFGGMASLFLGCSIMTILEVIYYTYKLLIELKKVNTIVDVTPN